MTATRTIGIIAGRGQFPVLAARSARASGERVVGVGFYGFTDPALEHEVDQWSMMRLGRINKLFKFLKQKGATHVCFAGAINKPKALDLRPDWRAVKLLGRVASKGDDALLRTLIAEIESEGFTVIQAADLVPELRGPKGVLTARQPDSREWRDLHYGFTMARQLGVHDIGQCLVVRESMIAAVEAMEGTDAAILRGGNLAGAGCVVVKTVKPGQEERIDLPALGETTIDSCIRAGASCLGYEAGKALFFDLETSLAKADAAGLSIVGIDDATFDGQPSDAPRLSRIK